MKKADSLAYLAKSCDERIAFNTRVFWLGKPFAHVDGNDLRDMLAAGPLLNAGLHPEPQLVAISDQPRFVTGDLRVLSE